MSGPIDLKPAFFCNTGNRCHAIAISSEGDMPIENSQRIELLNEKKCAQKLFLEPWAEELDMPPNADWVVEAVISGKLAMQVCFHDEGVAIHSSPESTMSVYSRADRTLLWRSFK